MTQQYFSFVLDLVFLRPKSRKVRLFELFTFDRLVLICNIVSRACLSIC